MTRSLPATSRGARVGPIAARLGLSADAAVVAGLAALSAALDLANLTISGFGNTYYAAAAQAGSASLRSMLYGAVDAGGFISLDKPPLATWLMSLSVRVLGLDPLAVLLPQALLGIGTVIVLYLAVRRSFGRLAGLAAGIVMAITPVTVLIFRYDNPDALLTFLLVAAAWAVLRGVDTGRDRWAYLAAGLVGAAFLTKFLQAYLVVPGFALAWLLGGPGGLRRRVRVVGLAAVVVLVASGWWVAIVQLTPPTDRPYVGGTASNSVLELIFGYDGLARLLPTGALGLGANAGGVPASAAAEAGASFAGPPGPLRLFDERFAGQIAWFLPGAAIALLAAGLRLVPRRRTGAGSSVAAASPVWRAGYLVWGGWAVVHVAVFSLMSGILHVYYAVALAPAIAALVGALVAEFREHRARVRTGLLAPAAVGLTSAVAAGILVQTPRFVPGLAVVVAIGGVLSALALAALWIRLRSENGRRSPALSTRRPPHLPMAAVVALAGVACLAGPAAYSAATIARPHSDGDVAAGPRGDGDPGVAGGTPPSPGLVQLLLANRGSADWIVAVRDSPNAAAIQLAADAPVMTLGGFTGADPVPTVPELQADVASGRLRYVLVGGGFDGHIERWVRASCSRVDAPAPPQLELYDCRP